MGTELMACPWCRSTCLNEDFDDEGWYVECNGCLARGPVADTPEEAEAAWQTELTPETLTKLVREMEKGRRRDTVRTEMELPYLMPLPLEAPIYELDLAETCPVCGGAKHRGEGVCGRCLLYGCARPGGRL